MVQSEMSIAERVVRTVAEAHGEDPLDLPPLEATISSDALNDLFEEGGHPPGALLLFPYHGVWVAVHSDGSVDVFKEYAATSGHEDGPTVDADRSTDDRLVILHDQDDRHVFPDDELETLHEIVDEADDSEQAWEDAMDYAERR